MRTFLLTLNTETSGRKRGMEKKFVLFQCSNDCQNYVILCSVKIPFFLTSQLLWKSGVNFRYTLTYFKVFVCLSGITILYNFHFRDLVKITFLFLLLKAGLLTWTRNPFELLQEQQANLSGSYKCNSSQRKAVKQNGLVMMMQHNSAWIHMWRFTLDKDLVPSAFAAFLLFPCLFSFAFL